MRLAIGRPWLTLAIDVFSRMVFGYHLSLDAPSSFAVGLCLCHGMLDKAAELAARGVKGEWPVRGKPLIVHSDNGKDFRSHLIQDSLDQYGIQAEFRPPLVPHYGGHIERLAGTLGRKIHALPGTTFNSPAQRGEYDAEAKARMTLRELQHWLLNLIVGVYHNKEHDGIGCAPIIRWRHGLAGREPAGPGLPGSNGAAAGTPFAASYPAGSLDSAQVVGPKMTASRPGWPSGLAIPLAFNRFAISAETRPAATTSAPSKCEAKLIRPP